MRQLHSDALGGECDGVDVAAPHADSFVFMRGALDSNNPYVRADLGAALDRYRPAAQSGLLDERGFCRHAD